MIRKRRKQINLKKIKEIKDKMQSNTQSCRILEHRRAKIFQFYHRFKYIITIMYDHNL